MIKQNPIKWNGSKRTQAENIVNCFPDKINTYYEPFVGGGSVMLHLIQRKDKQIDRYICSDLNRDVICLWNEIKSNPKELCDSYEAMWLELNKDDDKDRKKEYFYSVRDRFNTTKSPHDFNFIMRTTTNGMPRYNKDGEFNNSFHVTRNGIKPKTLRKIINQWSDILNKQNIDFVHKDIFDYKPEDFGDKDVLYLDPPYEGTKGMYFGGFDNNKFLEWLSNVDSFYALSYDGVINQSELDIVISKQLYDEHILLKSGNSSFRRVTGNSRHSIVYESLYIKK